MKKTLHIGGEATEFLLSEKSDASVRLELEGKAYHFTLLHQQGGWVTLQEEKTQQTLRVYVGAADRDGQKPVCFGEYSTQIASARSGARQSAAEQAGKPIAPMPGTIQKVLVKKGDKVKAGATLVVMEAMKMQLNIDAAEAGTVEAVHVKAGDKVSEGDELVALAVADAA